MLVNTGITPFLLNNLMLFTVCIGLSNTPTQLPFTNTLVAFARALEEHSVNNLSDVLALIHLIIGYDENPFVIAVLIDICLCKPMLPPSGVSTGSIKPHCVLCNK